LSGNLRPLIVKQSADDGGETIYVDPEDSSVKGKPIEPAPEYIEKPRTRTITRRNTS
jgi:hypothetical protein